MLITPELPLQPDMFSGKLADIRTRTQKKRDKATTVPQQNFMFSQKDIAQFGVNSHPQLPVSENTNIAMKLEREDPRTPEEIERDLQREAEKNTHKLFADNPELYEPPAEENKSELHPNEVVIFEQPEPPKPSKYDLYHKVVQSAEDIAFWNGIDGIIATGFITSLAMTILEAQEQGLTRAEIKAAVQIGEHRGSPKQQPINRTDADEPSPEYWSKVHQEAEHYWLERYRHAFYAPSIY